MLHKARYLVLLFFLIISRTGYSAIDQASVAQGSMSDPTSFTQTFTAGADGVLLGVWLYVEGNFTEDSTDVYQVSLYSRKGGNCMVELLTQGVIYEAETPTNGPDWYYVEFAEAYDQSVGDELTLRVTGTGTFGSSGGWIDFGVYAVGVDSYLGGAVYTGSGCDPDNLKPTTDYNFQTVINKQTGPEDFYSPSFIKVYIKNRLAHTISNSILAENLTTGSSQRFEGVSSATVTGESGQQWRFTTVVNDPTSNYYGKTLEDFGYTEGDSSTSIMPTSGETEVVLKVKNNTPRKMSEVEYYFTYNGSPRLYYATIYNLEAETNYVIQWSSNLKTWNEVETVKARFPQTEKAEYVSYPYIFEPGQYFRLKVVAPEDIEILQTK